MYPQNQTQPQTQPTPDPTPPQDPMLHPPPVYPPSPWSSAKNSSLPGNQPILTMEVEHKNKIKIPFKLLSIIVVILLMLAGLGFVGFSLADAYRAIPFSTPTTRQTGNLLIQYIPFLPKTPEQILYASIVAHQKVTSAHVNASLASTSQNLAGLLGSQNLDITLDGDIDWASVQNPKTNIHIVVSGIVDANAMNLDAKTYFKINSIPAGILGLVSGAIGKDIYDVSTLLNQWVEIDRSTIASEAREVLDKELNADPVTPFDEAYQEMLSTLYEDIILPSLIVKQTTKNDKNVHQINLLLSGDKLNNVVERLSQNSTFNSIPQLHDSTAVKPSDVIKSFSLDIFINRDNYYLNTVTIAMKVDNQPLLQQGAVYTPGMNSMLNRETFDVVFSLGLTNVGENLAFTPPAQTISLDEYTQKVAALFTSAPDETPETFTINP